MGMDRVKTIKDKIQAETLPQEMCLYNPPVCGAMEEPKDIMQKKLLETK